MTYSYNGFYKKRFTDQHNKIKYTLYMYSVYFKGDAYEENSHIAYTYYNNQYTWI